MLVDIGCARVRLDVVVCVVVIVVLVVSVCGLGCVVVLSGLCCLLCVRCSFWFGVFRVYVR